MICPEPSALQELVRDLHRQAAPWLPSGLGSRLQWTAPVLPAPGEREPVVVSTRRLDQLLELRHVERYVSQLLAHEHERVCAR